MKLWLTLFDVLKEHKSLIMRSPHGTDRKPIVAATAIVRRHAVSTASIAGGGSIKRTRPIETVVTCKLERTTVIVARFREEQGVPVGSSNQIARCVVECVGLPCAILS